MKINTSSIPQISSTNFTYDKYCGTIGISTVEILSEDCLYIQNGWEPVGKCEAKKLSIRPRPDGIAILAENVESGEICWFHYYM